MLFLVLRHVDGHAATRSAQTTTATDPRSTSRLCRTATSAETASICLLQRQLHHALQDRAVPFGQRRHLRAEHLRLLARHVGHAATAHQQELCIRRMLAYFRTHGGEKQLNQSAFLLGRYQAEEQQDGFDEQHTDFGAVRGEAQPR